MGEAAALYDRDGIWGNAPDAYQKTVRRDLLSVIPASCGSVLDVGCGDGYITNALPANMRVVGLDVGEASLKHLRRETRIGEVTALPFANGEFDLVMANDVVEHIPGPEFSRALAELQRVARRWVVVTVPLLERMEAGMTACPACGTVYHVNHHQRRFDTQSVITLLGDEWRADTVVFSGTVMGAAERATRLLRARGGLAGSWERSRCPACMHEGSQETLDGTVDGALADAALSHRWPSLVTRVDRSECVCLFRRTEESSRAIEAVPRWSLLDAGASPGRILPGALGRRGSHIAFVPGERTGGEQSLLVLQCVSGGVLFRLPEPAMLEGGDLDVPLWFLPPAFGTVAGLHAELDAQDILLAIAADTRSEITAGGSRQNLLSEAVSAQVIDLWQMQIALRAQVAAQNDEIRKLKNLLEEGADVRHRRDR
ncbi:MAG TPA: class I SAM-dependent methyltransferase [Bacteroidota bacterium]|nr:class I SAM-dependent methyltransferase [Bacteroidota bacterium]